MKHIHFKKYLLYKYYSGFLSKKFIPRLINNMSNEQLHEYLLKLKVLYNYSKKCYTLREQYTELCINEKERDIGHEIAISITKKYHYDISQFISKITPLIKSRTTYDITENKFYIFNKLETTDDEITNVEVINDEIIDSEITAIKPRVVIKTIQSDEEILDKIILEKQKIIDDIYNLIESKFSDYKVKHTMTLLYMVIQFLSLSNFDIIFNRLDDSNIKLLYNIILDIDKFDFIKLVVHVRKTHLFTNCNDNIDDIIYCDVLLKGETRINPIFIHKHMKISVVVHLLYVQLISNRIRDCDRDTFNEIIDGRLPRISKNIKSKNNVLDSSKNVHELINDNDKLYLYLDY